MLRTVRDKSGLRRIAGQSQSKMRNRIHRRQGVSSPKSSKGIKGLLAYAALKRTAAQMGLSPIKGENMMHLLKRVERRS